MTYRIEESPLGTYALYLNRQLIMRASNREDCEKVKTGLEHRHPDRKAR